MKAHKWKTTRNNRGQHVYLRHDRNGLVVASVERTPQGAILHYQHRDEMKASSYVSVAAAKREGERMHP